MPAKINIPLGSKFHHLTVLGFHGLDKRKTALWECICDCGKKTVVQSKHLRSGHTKSCGCLLTIHGMWRTPEFLTWQRIQNRCYNPNCDKYEYYGAKGIKVCDRWLESFENFYADMGTKPSPRHSIERINGNGDYSPENCRWATPIEQARNKDNNFYLTLNGVTMLAIEWAELHKWDVRVFYSRKHYGWSDEKILTTPLRITKRTRNFDCGVVPV